MSAHVVTVIAVGPAIGAGVPIGFSSGCVEFEEPLAFIRPEVFNGWYSSGQGSWVVGIIGGAIGATQLGEAWSVGPGRHDFGWDSGASIGAGVSRVVRVDWEEVR